MDLNVESIIFYPNNDLWRILRKRACFWYIAGTCNMKTVSSITPSPDDATLTLNKMVSGCYIVYESSFSHGKDLPL